MRAFLVLVILTACGNNQSEQLKPGACLPLPPAMRRNLTADPSGALYWLEPVHRFDYDGQLVEYMNLMRYDVRTRKSEVIHDHVEQPLTLMRGKLLALVAIKDGWGVAVFDRDGSVQLVTPSYFNASDLEPVDDHTVAILGDGGGERAVFTLDLDRQRPHYLVAATSLLNVSRNKLFGVHDGTGIMVDPVSGAREEFTIDKRGIAGTEELLFVEDSQIKAHALPIGPSHVVVSEKRPWKLVHQVGSVLARTPVEEGRSQAFLLAGTNARRLPAVEGGATITGATRLGDDIWALVEHNTANYVGDFGENMAEADICLLPDAQRVSFPTRNVPARYTELSQKLFDAAARVAPGGSVQILDRAGAPTTLYMELKEKARDDFDTMRIRVRDIAQKVTSLFGDREIKTELLFADRRTSMQRWRRDRLRKRTSYGMGDALMGDPADFDVEVRDLVNVKTGTTLTCSGLLVNLTTHPIQDVEVRCIWGDRTNVMQIAKLPPNTPVKFSRAFETEDGSPYFEVYKGREPLEVRDALHEARMQKVFELATDIYEDTKLSLVRHKAEDNFFATVTAPRDFAERTDEERRALAQAGFQRYKEGLTKIYGLEKDTPFVLRLEVELSLATYDFDGTDLRRVD